jgi:hypothetical protein
MALGAHCHGPMPAPLSRAGCSRQFGRASAPMIPQRVHTMRGPNDGTGMSSAAAAAHGPFCDRYWITSSAVANSVSGMVRPSNLAVCKLMTNSNFMARMTGRSAGFSPFKIRPV